MEAADRRIDDQRSEPGRDHSGNSIGDLLQTLRNGDAAAADDKTTTSYLGGMVDQSGLDGKQTGTADTHWGLLDDRDKPEHDVKTHLQTGSIGYSQ